MRRGWNVVRNRDAEGDERSLELAGALAAISDPDFLERVLHAKTMLDSVGGQIFIAAVRNKYAVKTLRTAAGHIVAEERDLLEDRKAPGEYETDAYLFHYDHIATALRDARKEADSEFPAEAREEEVVHLGEDAPLTDLEQFEADLVAAETAELNQNPPGDSAFEGG